MEEIWKDIEGYESLYMVSSLGRVKSLGNGNSNKSKLKIMKTTLNHKGYPMIKLCKEGVGKGFSVHRLVAKAFIPNPNNLPQVNHKDENKQNNCVENLEWCTNEYNHNYGTRIERVRQKQIGNPNMKSGLGKFGILNGNSRPILQFSKDWDFIKKWDSIADSSRGIGKPYKGCVSTISGCCAGKKKTAYGYKWGYADDYERIPFKVFDLEMYRKKVG